MMNRALMIASTAWPKSQRDDGPEAQGEISPADLFEHGRRGLICGLRLDDRRVRFRGDMSDQTGTELILRRERVSVEDVGCHVATVRVLNEVQFIALLLFRFKYWLDR